MRGIRVPGVLNGFQQPASSRVRPGRPVEKLLLTGRIGAKAQLGLLLRRRIAALEVACVRARDLVGRRALGAAAHKMAASAAQMAVNLNPQRTDNI